VKLGCGEVAEVEVPTAELDDPVKDDLRSNHGTATFLPEVPAVEVAEVSVVEVGLVELLVAEPALPLNEITANSSLPEAGLTIVSLTDPISPPVRLDTCAPVNWLPRTASWPMRPVALKW
jgi:hypothetical protein